MRLCWQLCSHCHLQQAILWLFIIFSETVSIWNIKTLFKFGYHAFIMSTEFRCNFKCRDGRDESCDVSADLLLSGHAGCHSVHLLVTVHDSTWSFWTPDYSWLICIFFKSNIWELNTGQYGLSRVPDMYISFNLNWIWQNCIVVFTTGPVCRKKE